MDLAVDVVVVDLGLEGGFDGACGPTERHPIAGARHILHSQILLLEPGGDLPDVVLTHTEAVGVLLRRQPLVIIRGAGVLLVGEN